MRGKPEPGQGCRIGDAGAEIVSPSAELLADATSFPLYSKGVERYRYEYAVFLLNKNVEVLMQEANIRLLDLRHTLPNLKVLLLTLSSPMPPSISSSFPMLSRSTTYVDSRSSSRVTSGAYPRPFLMSPEGSHKTLSGFNTPSPVKARSGLRRSLVVRTGVEEDEKSTASEDDLGSVTMSMSVDEAVH